MDISVYEGERPMVKDSHGSILRLGLSSMRLLFLGFPDVSSIFLDCPALFRYSLIFEENIPGGKSSHEDNNYLGKFTLKGLAQVLRGVPKIQVRKSTLIHHHNPEGVA